MSPTASDPVVLDSSGWLEYLTSGAKEEAFAPYLESGEILLLPTIVLYEVRKILLMRESKTKADAFYSEALKHRILPFDEPLALLAANLSITHKLSTADAAIYATAQRNSAQLVTSDGHFAGLPGVILL